MASKSERIIFYLKQENAEHFLSPSLNPLSPAESDKNPFFSALSYLLLVGKYFSSPTFSP
jgi:hypothetical protein